MLIGVSYEDGKVFEHVGDTEQFKVYEVENGSVMGTELCEAKGTGREMVIEFVMQHGIDVLICGRICDGAKEAVEQAGAEVFGCVEGEADEAVQAYLEECLVNCGTAVCEHHS